MPYVVNQGVRIYYEVEGEGPFVILQTGAAGDSNMWRQAGYIDGLQDFTKILIDHRGHGRSDRPEQIDRHRMENYVGDVLAVVDALSVSQSAFLGYSDGGRVGFALTGSYPDQITHLVSIGFEGQVSQETRQESEALALAVRQEGVSHLIGSFEEAEGIRFPDWLCDQFRMTDSEMFALELLAWQEWPGPSSYLGQMSLPVMLLVGEREDREGFAHRTASLMPRGRAVTLAGQGHIGAFLAADKVLAEVVPFLKDNSGTTLRE